MGNLDPLRTITKAVNTYSIPSSTPPNKPVASAAHCYHPSFTGEETKAWRARMDHPRVNLDRIKEDGTQKWGPAE